MRLWKEETREPWEVEPYGITDLEFALWGENTPRGPRVLLSNQSDCVETILFYAPEEIDLLLSHLQEAKKWLQKKKEIPS